VKGGIQFHKTNYTHPVTYPVIVKDSFVIGLTDDMMNSITNEDASADFSLTNYFNGDIPEDANKIHLAGTRGLFASRTNGFRAENIHFENFNHAGVTKMTPLQSCSECWHKKLWVVGSKTSHFKGITYENINGNYIFWEKWQR